MSAHQRARKRRNPPRNVQAAQQLAPSPAQSSGAAGPGVVPPQAALPSITLGQLKLLASGGARLGATIRAIEGGYRVEVDLGPRRWQLSSTHDQRPRVFRRLDGAAHAVRELGAQQARLELDSAASERR
jgi:hypothetical protein